MKKLLALVLALTMVMGLAVVGTNATYLEDKYTDSDSVNYEEAVAVMSSVGVLEGADNMFRPSVELKRSEAAKIVAYLNTNNKTAEGLVGVGKYSDVPSNHWAAGYIEYLSTLSIVAGNGDNTYNPDGDLKAVDFAKMLLVVLGYDPTIEGLVGNDYQINTMKLAVNAGLFNGMDDLKPTDVLTREEAAQMAFNTVKAPTVEYSNKGGSISINGADISLGASHFNYVTTTIAKQQNISDRKLTNTNDNDQGGYTVEFGERQYPDLYLDDDAEDPFGRPANEWTNGKEIVGLFVNKELMMGDYTVAVTGADLFELIGEAKIKNSEKIIYKVNGYPIDYIDPLSQEYTDVIVTGGELDQLYRIFGIAASNMIRGNKIPYSFTGNGVLTEVYEKNENIIIVSIYTYYAKATADYNEGTEILQVTGHAFNNGGIRSGANALSGDYVMNGNQPAPLFTGGLTFDVEKETVPEITKYKKDAELLIRVAWNDYDNFEVVEVKDPEIKKGLTISRYSTKTIGKDDADLAVDTGLFYEGWLITGGDTKNYSKTVWPDGLEDYGSLTNPELDTTYDVVYDEYGYVIHTSPNETAKKYVFIAGVDNLTSNLGVKYSDAFAIFADGSHKTIKVDVSKTDKEISEYNEQVSNNASYAGVNVGSAYSIHYDTMSNNGDLPLHGYNRWFTYSVSGEGANEIYALSPAPRSLMVGAQTGDNTNNKKVDSKVSGHTGEKVLSISTNSPRLVGDYQDYASDIVGKSVVSTRVAFGNEDSVYITVKTAKVSAKGIYATIDDNATVYAAAYRRGIAEVANIYTGLQSVNLQAYPMASGAEALKDEEKTLSKRNPFTQAIYAVYDKNNYIIAAIVIGENMASTTNYIYALESAGSEWKEDSYYYWDFKAVVDGEIQTLTCKSEYSGTFGSTGKIKNAVTFAKDGTVGGLFAVEIDKDGYVVDATQVAYRDVDMDSDIDTTDVYNNTNLENGNAYATAYDGEKVYHSYFTAGDTYYAKGQTLYNQFNRTGGAYELGSDIGLSILTGAPIFTVQQYRLKANGQYATEIKQFSDFKTALGNIAADNGRTSGPVDSKAFIGYVSAGLNTSNGRAKWVVLKNIGTAIDYENNKGTSNTTDNSKTVTLSDYTSNNGFTVTLTGFKAGTSYKWELLEFNAGQNIYVSIDSGTVKPTTSGGAVTIQLGLKGITHDPDNGVLKLGMSDTKSYKFVLDGVESNNKQVIVRDA